MSPPIISIQIDERSFSNVTTSLGFFTLFVNVIKDRASIDKEQGPLFPQPHNTFFIYQLLSFHWL